MEAILKASIAFRRRRPMFVCFRALRLVLSSHRNKIWKTELEENFTDTLKVTEVVSVVETYQSDETNLTFKLYWNDFALR